MAEPFGSVPGALPAGSSLPAGRDGHAPFPRSPLLATVIGLLGEAAGTARYQVESAGRLAILESALPLALGARVEVLLRREGDLWRAILLPGAGGGAAGGGPAPERPADESAEPRALPTGRGVAAAGGDGVASERSAAMRATEAAGPVAGDAETAPLARRLRELGIEPTAPLLRGIARVVASSPAIADGAPEPVPPPGTPRALALPLSRLIPELALRLPAETPALAELARALAALADPVLPAAERLRLPEALVRSLGAAVDALVHIDPRIAALRAAISALLADGGTSDLPAAARLLLAEGIPREDLPAGLTAAARARGVELLRAHEARAIAEHPALRALSAPLRALSAPLREVVEQAEAMAARAALDRVLGEPAAREAGERAWIAAAAESPPARVRWRRRGAAAAEGERGSALRFRLSTRWPGLGAIVVDGAISEGVEGPERSVELALAAEDPGSRERLGARLPELVASFEGSGLAASASIAPWRAGAEKEAAAGDGHAESALTPERLRALDRRA